ncbi:wrc [Abeliophyllum distichum]|uniref:Wrc n=1 Tax=Abeliophyllum distichum TaxID=126358 RepID=A0ABD1QWB6_9LAMI
MRIRKRFAPSSFSSEPLSDLQLNQSLVVQQQIQSPSNENPSVPEAKPKSDQPSNPPKQPSDQNMVICSEKIRWVLHHNAISPEKMEQMEMETWREEEKPSSNDIRNARILVQEVDIKVVQPSSSSNPDGRWSEGDKVIPLKKRKGTSETSPSNETLITKARMKSKTNKKCLQQNGDDDGNNSSANKGKKRGNVIMEGSRCSRVNGRGWRCCQPTLVGYALCEHHLGKGRLRSMTSVRKRSMSAPTEAAASIPTERASNDKSSIPSPTETTRPILSILRALDVDSKGLEEIDNDDEKKIVMVTKKRTKIGTVKARSISSLLGQIDNAVSK